MQLPTPLRLLAACPGASDVVKRAGPSEVSVFDINARQARRDTQPYDTPGTGVHAKKPRIAHLSQAPPEGHSDLYVSQVVIQLSLAGLRRAGAIMGRRKMSSACQLHDRVNLVALPILGGLALLGLFDLYPATKVARPALVFQADCTCLHLRCVFSWTL